MYDREFQPYDLLSAHIKLTSRYILSGRGCLLRQILRPVVALSGLFILVVALACEAEAPTPTPTPLPDTQSILEKSGEAMALLETFQFDLSHKGGGTPIAEGLVVKEVVGDAVKPDKLKLSWEGTFQGFFVKAQVITLEGETYMTDPITGRWGPLSGDVNPLGFFDPAVGIASIMSDLAEVSMMGLETVGDVATYRMKGTLPSQSLKPLLGTVAPDLMVDTEVWIGVEDMYLRQVVFRGRVTLEDAEDIRRTIKLSNFNQPVSIEAPKVE
ncbi:MAG: LppX_LprAFG lipoprotein [Chloroflexota bacterium]